VFTLGTELPGHFLSEYWVSQVWIFSLCSVLGSKRQSSDDESYLTSSSYEELGNIQVTIRHMTNYKILGEQLTMSPIQEIDKIHENAKKAMSHRIS
jgi:hypothetical protein